MNEDFNIDDIVSPKELKTPMPSWKKKLIMGIIAAIVVITLIIIIIVVSTSSSDKNKTNIPEL